MILNVFFVVVVVARLLVVSFFPLNYYYLEILDVFLRLSEKSKSLFKNLMLEVWKEKSITFLIPLTVLSISTPDF